MIRTAISPRLATRTFENTACSLWGHGSASGAAHSPRGRQTSYRDRRRGTPIIGPHDPGVTRPSAPAVAERLCEARSAKPRTPERCLSSRCSRRSAGTQPTSSRSCATGRSVTPCRPRLFARWTRDARLLIQARGVRTGVEDPTVVGQTLLASRPPNGLRGRSDQRRQLSIFKPGDRPEGDHELLFEVTLEEVAGGALPRLRRTSSFCIARRSRAATSTP